MTGTGRSAFPSRIEILRRLGFRFRPHLVVLGHPAVAGGALHREDGARSVDRTAAMPRVARNVNQRARPDDAILVAEDEMHLALEDQRELLLVRMLVQRRARP